MLTWILCALSAGLILQFALERLQGNFVETQIALSSSAMVHGRLWTLLTYPLVDSSIFYVLLNALGLFLIGRELAPLMGSQRFLLLCTGAVVLGGLAWLGVHAFAVRGTVLMGAASMVAALFITFACIYPEREVTFLLFFVLPVTLKPKMVAAALVVLEAVGLVFGEVMDSSVVGGINYSAHLGGMLAGWLYYRWFYANNGWDRAASPVIELPAWFRRRNSAPEKSPGYKVNLSEPADLRLEVDRILDKINSEGFGALTDDEKRLLDDAKDLLSRR
ncbi:MAG TPA: rhomboid family intramembrane serine protease [Candidatus Didemnitutus sp.]|nr:rhomboid family intramembrane serine protease [Candidatus Didemnitutus sp.]